MSVYGGGDWKDAFYAVQRGDLALLKYHIDQGIDLDFQHAEAFSTLLLESIEQEHVSIARLLLENGANPAKAEGYSGITPLKLAKTKKNKELVQLIKSFLPKKSIFFDVFSS